ncbi:tagatose 1,6-diphosphate aldolase [Acidobacteria bacterium AH-259-A15]|nr:tagatose 1,6-diphosphate aldolase [Acidobacteria bacterium AH-259-A15]
MAEISEGKLRGINAVADEQGVIRAAAMDQRGSLKRSLAKEKNVPIEAIEDEMMAEFKCAVIKILSPHASGVLLDPEYGLPASKLRHSGVGLLLAYEKSGYDKTQAGHIPQLLADWTVDRSKEAGADCVKLLIYYNPFEKASINDHKKNFVEKVGAECAHHDIPFFLEFVGYDPTGQTGAGEYARRKPDIVAESMREFSRDVYNVDVLKVEIPVDLRYTAGTKSFQGSEAAYSKDEAKELYLKAAQTARRPFIYLSAGVSDEQFRESLELAIEAGVNFAGVLCGRATWKDGIPVYARQGLTALEDWLADRGVKNMQALNEVLVGAHSWKERV